MKKHGNEPSLNDQITVLAIHYWIGTQPQPHGPYLTKREMEECLSELGLELDHTLDTAVGNLVDHEVLESFRPERGPDWYIIRQRDGEFVMGDDFPPAVRQERDRAINHIQSMDPSADADDPSAVADGGPTPKVNDDGETLREVIADKLDVHPSEVEDHLRSGRERDQRSKLNTVVEIVEESDAFSKPNTYDEISLVPKALRYHLSEDVIAAYGLH